MSTEVASSTSAVAEAGWYDDPAGLGDHRFWDGVGWTDHVASDGAVSDRPLPPDRAAVPPRGGWYIAFALLGGFLSATGLGLATRHLNGGGLLVRLVPSQFALWAFLLGACGLVSRRFGSGPVATDFGFRMRPADVGRGLVLSFLGRVAATLVLVPVILINRHWLSSNTQILHLAHRHLVDYIVISVFAVVGAPIVEELFFRGLLLRTLEPAWGRVPAIIGQAMVFGCCHIQVLLGVRNVAIVLATGAFGVVQGIAVSRYRRLGPAIWSHVFFNALAVLAVAASA